MKKNLTSLLAAALTLGALSAQAQITLDGVINANEIGTGPGKYVSLGKAFAGPHNDQGFGGFGLLQLYGANTPGKFYVGIAGSTEPSNNNFQLYLDLPNKTGVPVGTALPAIAGATTPFGTFTAANGDVHSIGGTKMEFEVDAAIALSGTGLVYGAVYKSATTAVAKSLSDPTAAYSTDGTAEVLDPATTTGDYALFAKTRLAYKAPAGNITTNPGNDSGGGAGSLALEYEFDAKSLGLPSGASIVKMLVAYVSPDAYWSSDVIPAITGAETGLGKGNLGFSPNFTALAGTQVTTLNLVALSSRQADETAVAMSVFPNPAQGQSTIAYRVLDRSQSVSIKVTDLVGRNVRTLLNGVQPAGIHELKVPAADLAAGTYLVKVQVGERTATRKLVLN